MYARKEDAIANNKKWIKNNKKKYNLIRNKSIIKTRINAIMKYGGRCQKCGFSDIRALEIDHVGGGGNYERKKLKISVRMLLFKMVKEEKINKKIRILCANCNTIDAVERNKELQKNYNLILKQLSLLNRKKIEEELKREKEGDGRRNTNC